MYIPCPNYNRNIEILFIIYKIYIWTVISVFYPNSSLFKRYCFGQLITGRNWFKLDLPKVTT